MTTPIIKCPAGYAFGYVADMAIFDNVALEAAPQMSRAEDEIGTMNDLDFRVGKQKNPRREAGISV